MSATQKELIDHCNARSGACSDECRYDGAECEAFIAKHGDTSYLCDKNQPYLYTDEILEASDEEGTTACSTACSTASSTASSTADIISRQAVVDEITEYGSGDTIYMSVVELKRRIEQLPSAQPEQRWIPCSERLPEERDWYLGIFKEPDTGWINQLPFICDYLLGKKTKATTKEGWILIGFTDREEYIDYYFNLECVSWMPLPEPYKEAEKHGTD